MRHAGFTGLIAGLLMCSCPDRVTAQSWSLDVAAGRTVFEPLAVDVGVNNVTTTVRYDAPSDARIYAAVAVPMGNQDLFWGATGAGRRFVSSAAHTRTPAVGVDVEAQAFLFRDPVVTAMGVGGVAEAIPFMRLPLGSGRVELRGGWRGQALDFNAGNQKRGAIETGARVIYGGSLQVDGEARWVHVAEGTFPFAGSSVRYTSQSWQAWARAGKWLSAVLDDVTLAAGAARTFGNGGISVWANVRQESPDPLFWNAPRSTWSVGVTRQWGGPRFAVPSTRTRSGIVEIRVPGVEADTRELSIAGSFSNWQLIPMHLEGREWVIEVPLGPGVYQYAFKTAAGRWFVPTSMAGRRPDGMGGYVAVLVVS
jgi:hypothetical protein